MNIKNIEKNRCRNIYKKVKYIKYLEWIFFI